MGLTSVEPCPSPGTSPSSLFAPQGLEEAPSQVREQAQSAEVTCEDWERMELELDPSKKGGHSYPQMGSYDASH